MFSIGSNYASIHSSDVKELKFIALMDSRTTKNAQRFCQLDQEIGRHYIQTGHLKQAKKSLDQRICSHGETSVLCLEPKRLLNIFLEENMWGV